MIKLINIITQNIILLGCCAISIFILFVLITFIKNVDDFAAITNMYDYIRMQNITIKIDTIIFKTIVILFLSRINNEDTSFLTKVLANVLKYIKHNKNKFPLKSTL